MKARSNKTLAPAVKQDNASALARNWRHEAQSALQFWQALEYLNPQSPPTVKESDLVWEFDADSPDEAMPWQDRNKQALIRKKFSHCRFQIFSGILDGRKLIEEARLALGAEKADMSERQSPSPVACVVLEANRHGLATGQVFVSTVPWAMTRIREHAGTSAYINFQGFFGSEGWEEDIRAKVKDLLVVRKLLSQENADSKDVDPAKRREISVNPESGEAGTRKDDVHPITSADVHAVTDLVFALCGWRPEYRLPWRIVTKPASEKSAETGKKQDDPLNSFFAEDIQRVSAALVNGNVGGGLCEYLRGEDRTNRIDLERNRQVIIDGVHPARFPYGCWPSQYPLVTAQQFAVNTIMDELPGIDGIFSVNGPPGTGKTTLLKDIVAAIVVRRADALSKFDNPESAFTRKLEIENYRYGTAYQLDEKLRGFGIVVSSANNGAVENITKELPGAKEIAPNLELDYFSIVADTIAAPDKALLRSTRQECWGAIAAVLGSKENRSKFVNRFWFADPPRKDTDGNPSAVPPDPLRLRSIQSLIAAQEHDALPWSEARARYEKARARVDGLIFLADDAAAAFPNIHATEKRKLVSSDKHQNLQSRLPALHGALVNATQAEQHALDACQRVFEQLKACRAVEQAESEVAKVQKELSLWSDKMPEGGMAAVTTSRERAVRERRELEEQYDKHLTRKPHLLAQIFRTEFSKQWNARLRKLEHDMDEARAHETSMHELVERAHALSGKITAIRGDLDLKLDKAAQTRLAAECANLAATDTVESLEAIYRTQQREVERLKKEALHFKANVDETEKAIQACILSIAKANADIIKAKEVLQRLNLSEDELWTWDLSELDRDSFHRCSPYAYKALFEARREVFIAAMNLHKSFIVAAWSKLRPTLQAFMNVLSGGLHPAQVAQGVSYLWDAFFLVVPLVSTTFASFPRLFAGIGHDDLAWLLIDEAGQATPQQAVGAIWRSKRTIVVGDPLQLEPVVSVPDELVTPLLARCGAEEQWAPPEASAQILADRANRYGRYLGNAEKKVWLGSPLVVHRRCLDPMFSIANKIAYDEMMVYGAGEDQGDTGIGSSCWIDIVDSQSDGHWIESQGDAAMTLVQKITGGTLKANGRHKAYVITPFRQVAEKIQSRLFAKYGKESHGMSGTVHTFQGKEAEHVIFLLGGDPSRSGVISSFAGKSPNLVNVAVTRAKRRLYVIGNRRYWTSSADIHGIYQCMADHLPNGAISIQHSKLDVLN